MAEGPSYQLVDNPGESWAGCHSDDVMLVPSGD
jgi:hypothetical protein